MFWTPCHLILCISFFFLYKNLYSIHHWFCQILREILFYSFPHTWKNFSKPCSNCFWTSSTIRKAWLGCVKLILKAFPDMLDRVHISWIRRPVFQPDIICRQPNHRRVCLMYWSIILHEYCVVQCLLSSFIDRFHAGVEEASIDKLIDRFDDNSDKGTTIPPPKTAPNHPFYSPTLLFRVNTVLFPFFPPTTKYPYLTAMSVFFHWALITPYDLPPVLYHPMPMCKGPSNSTSSMFRF